MTKIKLTTEPNEIYFKTITNYELEIDDKPLTIRIEEDSNERRIHYKHGTGWCESPPDWILEIGEDDWGELIFEKTIREYLSYMVVNKEIETNEE